MDRRRPDWHEQAACKGMDPAVFAPWDPGVAPRDQDPTLAAAAKEVCARCPVLAECAEGDADRFVVRAGMTPAEQMGFGGHICPDCGRGCVDASGLGVHRRQAHGWVPECGTPGGHGRHTRAGEEPCGPCRDAMNAYRRERRGLPPLEPASCGTEAGYRRHRRHGEDACPACREANAIATRRRRRVA